MNKDPIPTKNLIIASTIELLGTGGLGHCSIDNVSRTAGCAKGLINYHFGSKDHLLDTVAALTRDHRGRARIAALATGPGTIALDALWDLMVLEVTSGQARIWLVLTSIDRHRGQVSVTSESASEFALNAAHALSLDPAAIPPLLLLSVLEGLQLQLLSGTPAHEVREAFDQFWLGVLQAESN